MDNNLVLSNARGLENEPEVYDFINSLYYFEKLITNTDQNILNLNTKNKAKQQNNVNIYL